MDFEFVAAVVGILYAFFGVIFELLWRHVLVIGTFVACGIAALVTLMKVLTDDNKPAKPEFLEFIVGVLLSALFPAICFGGVYSIMHEAFVNPAMVAYATYSLGLLLLCGG